MLRKRAHVKVTEEILTYALFKTLDLQTTAVEFDPVKNIFILTVTGDSLEPVIEGGEGPLLRLMEEGFYESSKTRSIV